jgi:signal transduction histidine kinase/DNA-binding response OmpR family regulator
MTQETVEAKETTKGLSLFRTLIFAFSALAAFSCLSIGALTYYMRATGIRTEQYRLLETLRDEKMATISFWYNERSGDMRVMTKRPDVVELCEAHTKGDNSKAKELLPALEIIQEAYSYEAVFIADSKGAPIVSTERDAYALGSLPKREAYLQRVIKEKRIVLSDVWISKIHEKPARFLFAPIFTPGTTEVVGVFGILVDPTVSIHPQFSKSEYLGETGEILLVNGDGLAQSPLKYREDAMSTLVIRAEPARRGAAGEIGIVADKDYRHEPVMAAYGYISEFNWGIVVKQDMAEINMPVVAMAKNVLSATVAILAIALILSLIIARRISLPARRIAGVAKMIGRGDLNMRAPVEGPLEIEQIAMSMNNMLDQLAMTVRVAENMRVIVSAAGRHSNTPDLLAAVLPMLMEVTRSQIGVVYLAGASANRLDQALIHGIDPEGIAKELSISPPDHLLAESLASGKMKVLSGIPLSEYLRIKTQAGTIVPRALLSLPLIQRGTVVGVVGLASLYDYDDDAQQIADGIRTNLAQALELCGAFRESERVRAELDAGNQELTVVNEELRTNSEELQQQSEELRTLAEELDAQRVQVSQSDKLKSEFLSNMSHELRTPLNSVLSLTQLMLEDGLGPDGGENKERLEIIERNGKRLLNLINDILDLSKIEAGRMELYVSSFHVAEQVDAVVGTIRPLADERGLSIKVDVAEMDAMQSDKEKLHQILINLLSNAQKFTKDGEIGVKARQDGASIVFTVWDTGIGISEKDMPHIFNEFRQVDGSTTRQYGGTGLGLAISQRLALALGGRIEIESELGKGTTFTVTLPMMIVAKKTAVERDAELASNVMRKWQPSGQPPRILVVEDNAVARDQIERALKAKGFVVDTAKDGEEGLAKTRAHIPDGMILNLMMPRVDGFQVLDTIRSRPETAHLPVLVLTAKDISAAERASLSHNNVKQLIQKGSLDRSKLVLAVCHLIGMQDEPPAEAPPPRIVRRKGGKVTVLVADDNADNRKTTKALLRGDKTLELFEASNGKEAVELAKAKRPDIILMDIHMPIMGGVEATREIKQDKNLRNTVVIALTASAMIGDKEELLAEGLDDYIAKPVGLSELKAMLRKWIG